MQPAAGTGGAVRVHQGFGGRHVARPAVRLELAVGAGGGVTPGAYHFFTLCKPGAEQARNFLAALADATGSGLPPAVDLEFGGNCEHRPAEQELTRQLNAFLEQIKRETGCTPGSAAEFRELRCTRA